MNQQLAAPMATSQNRSLRYRMQGLLVTARRHKGTPTTRPRAHPAAADQGDATRSDPEVDRLWLTETRPCPAPAPMDEGAAHRSWRQSDRLDTSRRRWIPCPGPPPTDGSCDRTNRQP